MWNSKNWWEQVSSRLGGVYRINTIEQGLQGESLRAQTSRDKNLNNERKLNYLISLNTGTAGKSYILNYSHIYSLPPPLSGVSNIGPDVGNVTQDLCTHFCLFISNVCLYIFNAI